MLAIETDYSDSDVEQIATRVCIHGDDRIITVGIDAGAATTKAVILRDDTIAAYRFALTGFDFLRVAESIYRAIRADAGIQGEDVEKVIATGYGRKNIQFANKTVSEITAHAAGVRYLFPDVRGIIDIGGQDSEVTAVESGTVVDFLMNDKCAAGTGKFLEFTAKALEVSIEALGSLALASRSPRTSAARA